MMVQQSKVKTSKIIKKPLFSTAFCTLELTKCKFVAGQNFTYKLITVSTTTNQFLAYQNKLVRAE